MVIANPGGRSLFLMRVYGQLFAFGGDSDFMEQAGVFPLP